MSHLMHELSYRSEGAIDKVQQVRILVCGVGAIGSNLVDNLVRQGFGNIDILDYDVVEAHNIGTQTYGVYDVGQFKVDALSRKIYRDTKMVVNGLNKELVVDNKDILQGYDLIIDTFDNNAARKTVFDYCSELDIDCVHAGMSSDGYAQVVWNDKYIVPQDNEDAIDVCDYPLARNLVLIISSLLSEVIMQFVVNEIKKNLELTLKDMTLHVASPKQKLLGCNNNV